MRRRLPDVKHVQTSAADDGRRFIKRRLTPNPPEAINQRFQEETDCWLVVRGLWLLLLCEQREGEAASAAAFLEMRWWAAHCRCSVSDVALQHRESGGRRPEGCAAVKALFTLRLRVSWKRELVCCVRTAAAAARCKRELQCDSQSAEQVWQDSKKLNDRWSDDIRATLSTDATTVGSWKHELKQEAC